MWMLKFQPFMKTDPVEVGFQLLFQYPHYCTVFTRGFSLGFVRWKLWRILMLWMWWGGHIQQVVCTIVVSRGQVAECAGTPRGVRPARAAVVDARVAIGVAVGKAVTTLARIVGTWEREQEQDARGYGQDKILSSYTYTCHSHAFSLLCKEVFDFHTAFEAYNFLPLLVFQWQCCLRTCEKYHVHFLETLQTAVFRAYHAVASLRCREDPVVSVHRVQTRILHTSQWRLLLRRLLVCRLHHHRLGRATVSGGQHSS